MPLAKIITLTRSGYTAKMISRFKIKQPIIAVTSNQMAKKQLELVYGVVPIYYDYDQEPDRLLAVAKRCRSLRDL